jgi:hypothetical protein
MLPRASIKLAQKPPLRLALHRPPCFRRLSKTSEVDMRSDVGNQAR